MLTCLLKEEPKELEIIKVSQAIQNVSNLADSISY